MFRPRALSIFLVLFVSLAACAGPKQVGLDGLPTPEPAATPTLLYPISVVDASGQTLTLDAAPQHIVSASLAADEVLASLVEPDRLAAISHRATDEAVSNLVELTGLDQIERLPARPTAADITGFRPDLVIVPAEMDPGVADELREQGRVVYVYAPPVTLAELNVAIDTLGRLVGEPERAAGLADGVAARIAEIQRQIGEIEEPPAVLYYAGGGRIAGRGTVPDQIIQLAGGINVADVNGWGQITDVELAALNPAFIITPPGQIDNELEDGSQYADIQAVRNNLVLPISDPEMLAQSQYMVRGVAAVAKFLYTDRVSD